MAAAEAIEHKAPNPGPQTAFLSSPADIAWYGGAAGGGKTWALLLDAVRWYGVKGYSAVLFRRTYPELLGGGGLWDEAQEVYPALGGLARESPHLDYRFPSGAHIQFRHLQHEKDVRQHDGGQYAFVGFDQLEHFTEKQWWRLVARLRSQCGVKPYARATLNPDPDHWTRKFLEWWIGPDGYPIPERSGVVRWFVRVDDEIVWGDDPGELEAAHPQTTPMSFTFVPAKLTDNPKVDPGYRAKLRSLPRVERERLELGNWDVRAAAGTLFQRSWFTVVSELPSKPARTIRFWDKASTKPSNDNPDPDWTRGAKVSRLADGSYAIEHIEGLRDRPGSVLQAMRKMAEQDGFRTLVGVWQDPGAAGVADIDKTAEELRGHRFRKIRASQNKVAYAEVWSAIAEHGTVYVVRGPWNEAFFREIEAFPDGAHDDQVDAVSGGFQVLTQKGGHRIIEAFSR